MADQLTAFPNGLDTHVVRDGVKKTAAYTVVADTDCGKTFYIKGAAVVFTLPSIDTGQVFNFVNMNEDGKFALSISPAALDGISYKGASVDNKDVINTAATSKKGDSITITSFDGADHWQVSACSGVWDAEA